MPTGESDINLTARPGVWNDLASIVSAFVDEASLHVNQDGLHIAEVDPMHVALIVVDVPSSAFEEYEAPFESRIGLDVDKLKLMLRAGGERSVTLRHLPGKNGTMLIDLSMPGGHAWRFDEIEDERFNSPRIPATVPSVRFYVPAAFIQDAIKLGECVSDHVVISHGDGEAVFAFGMGDSDGSSVSRFRTGASGKARSTFPLDYFNSFFRAIGGQVALQVELGTDHPFMVSGETASGVRFRYYLAPRITDEGRD